jgi:hypothetical protein
LGKHRKDSVNYNACEQYDKKYKNKSMKYAIIIIAGLVLGTSSADAQTKSGKKTSSSQKSKTSAKKSSAKPKKSKLPPGTAIHGHEVVPLYHGKHDYTPGSPVGTGGAGGGTMAGSQQGSAEENALGKKSSNELLKKDSATKK